MKIEARNTSRAPALSFISMLDSRRVAMTRALVSYQHGTLPLDWARQSTLFSVEGRGGGGYS